MITQEQKQVLNRSQEEAERVEEVKKIKAEEAEERAKINQQLEQRRLEARQTLEALNSEECEEALAELVRELTVRDRCFPRWINEGRISKIDARDRVHRQRKAVEIVGLVVDIVYPSA
jgi:hypothetical protein